jgi:hypothetical protein
MSDKTNKYGYVGVNIPDQNKLANAGIFSVNEINDLVADDNWSSIEDALVFLASEEITASTSSIEFRNLDFYQTYFLVWSQLSTPSSARMTMQFYISDTLDTTTGAYRAVHENIDSNGSSAQVQNNGSTSIMATGQGITSGYGYIYQGYYSSGYRQYNHHAVNRYTRLTANYGGGHSSTDGFIDGIKLNFNATTTGYAAIYGIRNT